MDPLSAGILGGSTLLGGMMNFASNAGASANAHKANNAAQKALQTTEGFADKARQEGLVILQQMLNANRRVYGSPEQAAAELQAAKAAANGINPYEAGEFSYGKELEDFYDNALGLRMNAANDAINSSQALGGNLFSSDTANKLTAQAQVLGSEAYKDAMAAYQADKGMEANIWNANEQAKQAAANSAANLAQMKYGMASDTAGNIADANNSYYQSLMGLNDDYWQNRSDYVAQLSQLMAQDPGGNSGLSWFFGH